MALRYRKSIKLGKGVKLNIGKKSAGISLGGKYGGVSFNSRNGARVRASAPGTGLSYTEKVSTKTGAKKRFKDFEDFADVDNEGFADEIAADETAPVEAPKKKKHIGIKIFVGLVLLAAFVEACGGNEEAPAVTPSPTEKIVQSAEPEKSPAPTQEVEETAKPEKTKEPEKTQKPVNTTAPKKTSNSSDTSASAGKPSKSPSSDTVPKSELNAHKFVGSKESDKYHYPTCRFAEKILDENAIYFESAYDAEAADYEPCGVCHPHE